MSCLPTLLLVAPETSTGHRFLQYYRVVLAVHVLLIIAYGLSQIRYSDMIFDGVVLLMAMYSCARSAGVAMNLVCAYATYMGIGFFFALINLFMYLNSLNSEGEQRPSSTNHHAKHPTDDATVNAILAPHHGIAHYAYLGSLFVAPIIYLVAAEVSYKLYKELKIVYVQTLWDAPNQYQHQYMTENTPLMQETPQGFTPFSGTAYRLDSTQSST